MGFFVGGGGGAGGLTSGPYALLQDQKTTGTDGGTFTSGARRTRDLSTKVEDEIGITLSSNQFTLPAGEYEVWGRAPSHQGNSHQAWLRNVTDGEDTIVGSPMANTVTATAMSDSVLHGKFTIAATKTFEIQHQNATTRTINGFGVASSFGPFEVYASIRIEKVA